MLSWLRPLLVELQRVRSNFTVQGLEAYTADTNRKEDMDIRGFEMVTSQASCSNSLWPVRVR